MPDGISVLTVNERPSISRAGKLVNEVVIEVETDNGASGQIVMKAAQYSKIVQDPDALGEILTAKRDELDAPFLA